MSMIREKLKVIGLRPGAVGFVSRCRQPLCQSVQDNRDLDPRVADAGPSAAGLGVQSNPPFVGRFLHDRSSPFDTTTVS